MWSHFKILCSTLPPASVGLNISVFDDWTLFIFVYFFARFCSQTHSAAMLTLRTTTWWLSCKNVSTTRTAPHHSFSLHLENKRLACVAEFPHTNTQLSRCFSFSHHAWVFFYLHVIQSHPVIRSRRMRMLCFVFNKWKRLVLSFFFYLNSFQTLPRTMMPTSRRSPGRS